MWSQRAYYTGAYTFTGYKSDVTGYKSDVAPIKTLESEKKIPEI